MISTPSSHRRSGGHVLRLAAAAALALPVTLAGTHGGSVHAASASSPVSRAMKAAAGNTLAHLPMRFERNVGQSTGHAPFIARGMHYGLALSPTSATLALSRSQQQQRAVVQMHVVGGNANARMTGQNQLRGVTNYFIGKSAAQWHTGIHSYGQVRVAGVYKDIDLVYHGSQQRLEYDFVVAAGANPSAIRLRFDGAQKLSLDARGNLVLRVAGGTLVQQAPVLYQGHATVSGRFVLLGHNTVGFAVGRYDHAAPLTIDPTVLYATYLGGSGYEYGFSVATDGKGNIFLDGYSENAGSDGFPTPAPAGFRAGSGFEDAFVAKIVPLSQGQADLAYFDYLGGSAEDYVYDNESQSLAVDAGGNAYVIGTTVSSDFPTTPGAYQTQFNAGSGNKNEDAFVTKVSPTGTGLVYSTYLGGSDADYGDGIVVDAAGNADVTGETFTGCGGAVVRVRSHAHAATKQRSSHVAHAHVQQACASVQGVAAFVAFPTTNGTFGAGNYDVFVSRLNAAGSMLPYSTLLGGFGDDEGSSVALDRAGNIIAAGYTDSGNFPTTTGAFQTTNVTGDSLGFVSKLNPAAGTTLSSQLLASTLLGGSNGDSYIVGVRVDPANNVDVAGYTYDNTFPTTPGAYNTTFTAGEEDEEGFVSQLSNSLSTLRYSTFFFPAINNNYLDIYALAVDQVGTIYITGYADDPVPATSGAFTLNPGICCPADPGGAFVAELIPNLTLTPTQQLAFSTLISGNYEDDGYGIAVDANGFVYVAGEYDSSDGFFPVTAGAYQTTFGGGEGDAFALKFLPAPEPAPLCTVAPVVLQKGTTRLGFVGSTNPLYPIQYISYQVGTSNFQVRNPVVVSCIRPGLGTAVVTATGTISGYHGTLFTAGGNVTVTLSLNPSLAATGPFQATYQVTVTPLASTIPYYTSPVLSFTQSASPYYGVGNKVVIKAS